MKLNGGIIGKNISGNSGVFNINAHHLKTINGEFPNPDIDWSITQGVYNLPKRPFFRIYGMSNHGEIFFSADGLKLFEITTANDDIYEYHLMNPWDINSATQFATHDFTSYDSSMSGIWFDPTGMILYLIGYANDKVYQFSLTKKYDPSTAISNGSFDVSSQETNPFSVSLSVDGSKLYIVGVTGDDITQYDLSTAFNVTTASNPQTFDPDTDQTYPTGHYFKPDGTKLYFVGNTPDELTEYTLTTPWDVTTAGSKISIDMSQYDTYGQSIFFKEDGTKMYFVGTTMEYLWEFTLSTPWDISTKYLDGDGYEIPTGGQGNSTDLFLKSDGTKMYIIGASSNSIYEYNLSSAFDLSTATVSYILNVNADDTNASGMFFKSDGTRFFICGTTGDMFHQYDLSTAWDLSTATITISDRGPLENGAGLDPQGIYYSPDGTKMYYISSSTDTVYQHNLSTAWSLPAGGGADVTLSISGEQTVPYGLFFKSDGTILYITGATGDDITAYTLSTAWDISTATYSYDYLIQQGEPSTPTGLWLSSDGTKLFVTDSSVDSVRKFDMSTPWDVRTSSNAYYKDVWHVEGRSGGGTGYGFALSRDGINLYVLFGGGNVNSYIRQYTLTTPYDVTTAVYNNKEISTVAQEYNGKGIAISEDGTKLFTTGSTGDDFNIYTLSTAFDLDTATFTEVKDSHRYSAPEDMVFSDDGTRIYVTEMNNQNGPWQFNLSAPYDLSHVDDAYNGSSSIKTTAISTDGLYSGLNECEDVIFKPDGTKMYISGDDAIRQYDLTVAWESSSAYYRGQKTGITIQRMAFKSDGTALIVIDPSSYRIKSYSLTTPWDITTITTTNTNTWLQYNSQDSDVKGLTFSASGDKMYILGDSSARIWQYNLSTPFLPSSSTGTSYISTNISTANPRGFCFSTDGSYVFITGRVSPSRIHKLELSTPWNIATMNTSTISETFTYEDVLYGVYNEDIWAIAFSADGTKMYISVDSDGVANRVREYQLASPFSINSAGGDIKIKRNIRYDDMRSVAFDKRGKTMIAANDQNVIRRYTLDNKWDTMVTDTGVDTVPDASYGLKIQNITGINFSDHGKFLYTLHTNPNWIIQHKISSD